MNAAYTPMTDLEERLTADGREAAAALSRLDGALARARRIVADGASADIYARARAIAAAIDSARVIVTGVSTR